MKEVSESLSYESFKANTEEVLEKMASACELAGRPVDAVRLLPVTKTHPSTYAEYALRMGFKVVGENRVQEAVDKKASVSTDLGWELIGHLQSNKVKVAVAHFERIQAVDSVKLARKLDTAANAIGKCQRILLQVNAGDDPAKFGLSCDESAAALEAVLDMKSLSLEGLMTIAPLSDDPEVARRSFERLRRLRDKLCDQYAVALDELSMGMSGDMEEAVMEGSTVVRVGSALFGSRK